MPATPTLLKEITLTIGTEDFAPDAIDAEIVPTPGPVQTVRTLDAVTHQDAASESWSLRINAVVDWDSARPGLAYYLFTNKGTQVAFTFKKDTSANSAASPLFTGTLTCVPMPAGGDGNVYAEAEVLLPITGEIVLDPTP